MQFIYEKNAIDELRKFAGDSLGDVKKERNMFSIAQAEIKTLEDGSGNMKVTHIATEGDWIIKGVAGEFYACKDSIFRETYEPV